MEFDERVAVEINLSPDSSFSNSFNIELTLGNIICRYIFLHYRNAKTCHCTGRSDVFESTLLYASNKTDPGQMMWSVHGTIRP